MKQEELIVERLRNAIIDIRRKPYPISDLIPLLAAAADSLERMNEQIDKRPNKYASSVYDI